MNLDAYHLDVLKALDAITNRPQPHVPYDARLKFITGLTNSTNKTFHPRLEDLFVNFRRLNRSRSNQKSEYELRKAVQSVMYKSADYPHVGLPSVFLTFKILGMEVTSAEKRAIMMLDPSNRPQSPKNDWHELMEFLRVLEAQAMDGKYTGEDEWRNAFTAPAYVIPRAYKTYQFDKVSMTSGLAMAGETHFFPDQETCLNSDIILICEELETAHYLFNDTEFTPAVATSNPFNTALIVAQITHTSPRTKRVLLISKSKTPPHLKRLQNMVLEGALCWEGMGSHKIALVDLGLGSVGDE